MGTVTYTKFKCDRCGCIHDEPPKLPVPRITVRIEVEEDWHTKTHVWKELCKSCNAELLRDYKLLLPKTTEAQTNDR